MVLYYTSFINLPCWFKPRPLGRKERPAHYHLDYTPLLVQCADNPINFVMEANQTVWYKVEQLNKLGLAAPIKRLLQSHKRIK